jgi:hypothetical protein
VARTGTSGGVLSVTHKAKDGTVTTVGTHDVSETHEPATNGQTGMAGSSMEVLIPGPERSFKSVRISGWAFLPSKPTNEQMAATMDRCADLVQQHLAVLSAEAKKFLNE